MIKETTSYKMKLISINDYYINSAEIDAIVKCSNMLRNLLNMELSEFIEHNDYD